MDGQAHPGGAAVKYLWRLYYWWEAHNPWRKRADWERCYKCKRLSVVTAQAPGQLMEFKCQRPACGYVYYAGVLRF